MVRRIWDNRIDNGDGTFGAVVEVSDEEAQLPDTTPADLDAMADALADRVLQQNLDATRAIGETLAEVVWRVSNGTVPQGITEEQARAWVRDTFRAKYRALL